MINKYNIKQKTKNKKQIKLELIILVSTKKSTVRIIIYNKLFNLLLTYYQLN